MSWSFVDKIIFINLDESTDRLEHMETHVLPRFPAEKVIRFPAIRAEPGYLGCSLSHIACLRMAMENKWESVLIMEDDAMWNRYKDGYDILEMLADQDYDVIYLGATGTHFDPTTYRLYRGLSTVAYLVHRHYYETLLANFTEGLGLLRQHPSRQGDFAIDVYTHRLQAVDRWFLVYPNLVYQEPFYSNIEKRDVDYRSMYHL